MRGALPLLLLAPVLLSPGAARAADPARGTFGVPDREALSVVDAFAWRGERSWGEGGAIRVFLSDRPLDREAIDRAIDLDLELERQSEGAAWAELEVDPESVAWLGSSFSLPDGWGCGWCSAGEKERARARLRIENGRLKGRIDVSASDVADGSGVDVELTLDVPITPVDAGEPLPVDGGEPARALQVCRASVLAGHEPGLRSFCLPPDDAQLAAAAHVVEAARLDVALYGRDALRAAALTVLGGRVKGDRALLRVETRGTEGRQRGEVLMIRTPAGWRFDAERLSPVWEEPEPASPGTTPTP